ncbi:MAG: four-carbon acid sugar kinase family protein [Burkholderiales bacterium]
MNDLRILADDLTGALDTAAAFGAGIPVHLDAPAVVDAARVAAVATATRDVPLGTLPAALSEPVRWLAGGDLRFKKVDSLLRGNTYAEVAYAARAGNFSRVVFAAAFPQQGRITLDGRQWLLPPGRPLAERKPIDDGWVADAFGVFGLPVVATSDARERSLAVWIPDVRNDDDLTAIAAHSAERDGQRWLWCGSAGLAFALARQHGFAPGEAAFPPAAGPGPLLLISASHHPVVRKQWTLVRDVERAAIVVPHSRPAALRSAFRAMADGVDVAMFDLSPTRLLIPAEAAKLLASQMQAIVGEAPRPAAVIVVGGDTLRNLCRAAGADGLVAGATVRTGWGCAQLTGGRWNGVPCFSRSGAFGDPDDLATMVQLVMQRTVTTKERG